MIKFNGKKYAKNEKEFTDSLFSGGSTCNGFYKKYKRKIMLYNIQNELIACIVNNGYSERFIVSASVQNGKPWFMYALCDDTSKYLGLQDHGYREQHDEVNKTIKEVYGDI
jgi:hypothetical protein